MRLLGFRVGILLLVLGPAAGRASEEVELIPVDPAGFGLRNVGAAITSVFGAWGYWYDENVIEVETAPSDAQVDLFYVRANFQKIFVRTSSPVRVRLPSRVQATPRDALIVRVSANGFRTQEQTYRVTRPPGDVVITLEPLPNSLVFLGHTHIGGRTTLSLRTTEKPEFRVIKSRGSAGFSLVLADTANRLDPPPLMSGGLVRSVEVTSVGEDLIVQIATRHPEAEVRSKTGYDRIRGEHLFSLDLTEPGVRLPGPAVIRREVGRFAFTLGDRCHERFEEVLRERLDAESLARASRSMGGLTDLYRREAMLRLGRLDHGQVWTLSGERFRTGSALELEVALQSAGSIPGYLALLGAYARTQEDSGTVLRSLVVPDLDAATFAPIHEAAEAAWRGCRRARSR